MKNPIDFDSDGKVTAADAKAFYLKFPFWAGFIVGAVSLQVARWVFNF
jgi:hypothetical protein